MSKCFARLEAFSAVSAVSAGRFAGTDAAAVVVDEDEDAEVAPCLLAFSAANLARMVP